MALMALPIMSIWVGKASRNSPDTRKVTSTRGRFSSLRGVIAKPVTRPEVSSHTGRAPIRASACATSSPPVRMFDVAHDYGRTTAFSAGKARLAICDRSYNETNGAPDVVDTGGDNGRDKIDLASVLDISGPAISNQVNAVLADLTNATPKHYTFIHIAEPDQTGHSQNWGTPNWSNAVRMVDAQLGRIMNAIDTNPALLNQTALIVTADHGERLDICGAEEFAKGRHQRQHEPQGGKREQQGEREEVHASAAPLAAR